MSDARVYEAKILRPYGRHDWKTTSYVVRAYTAADALTILGTTACKTGTMVSDGTGKLVEQVGRVMHLAVPTLERIAAVFDNQKNWWLKEVFDREGIAEIPEGTPQKLGETIK